MTPLLIKKHIFSWTLIEKMQIWAGVLSITQQQTTTIAIWTQKMTSKRQKMVNKVPMDRQNALKSVHDLRQMISKHQKTRLKTFQSISIPKN